MLYAIVPINNPLTDFLFADLKEADWITIIRHPQYQKSIGSTLVRSIEAYILFWLRRSSYFEQEYIDQLIKIKADDTVLFFSIENRKDLQIICKFIATKDLHQWIWNPIRTYRRSRFTRVFYKFWLTRVGIRSYTFDPADALKYGFTQRSQVFRAIASDPSIDQLNDVFFVGSDKGRLEILKEWKHCLEQHGLKTHFHIVPDRKKKYTALDMALLTNEYLSYDDNISIIRQSRCLLELMQSTQSGPTIRSLEAAFLGKKLITNNKSIRYSEIYNPTRVFIVGEDDLQNLRAFIDSDQEPITKSTLAEHEIAHWIKGFGSQTFDRNASSYSDHPKRAASPNRGQKRC